MARPRRARRRVSGRILVSSSLVLVTALASLTAWRMADSQATVALPEETTTLTEQASTSPIATPAESPSAAASTAAQTVDWNPIVAECRQVVEARDTVIARATIGVGHWSQHVQAQTDANAGRISVKTMKKIFTRTRLLGAGDVSSYRDAVNAAERPGKRCEAAEDAPAQVRATLEHCAARLKAQAPVLSSGARGMADWNSHLAAMRRSRQGHAHNAQKVWIDAWRAAPPNIQAFDKAVARFEDATAC